MADSTATSSDNAAASAPPVEPAESTNGQQQRVWTKIPPRFVPTPFPYHHEVVIRIEPDLSDMGWGTGKLLKDHDAVNKEDEILATISEDWQVRVPLVLPGEVVKCRIHKNFDTYSEADLVQVIEASEERVEPTCPLAGTCGGCQFQHMKIERQREWKMDFVRRHLHAQKIDGYTSLDTINEKLLPTKGTDEIYHYRNKLTPHYQAPVKMGDDEYELKAIGFQQVNSRNLVDVEDCPIATPAINVTYKETRTQLQEQAKQ
ncbi:MAG: hypothetical protein SGARI_007213, partial [Bacillariaceae sp.]